MSALATARAVEPRERIVSAAAALLADGGRKAVSTRAVCAAADVQSPTIYRLFGDMQGLLDAVAAHGFARHLQDKASLPLTDDPVADLRAGWDQNVRFALDNPALYSLVYGELRSGPAPAAAVAAAEVLADYVHRVAEAGRLRMTEEHAAQLIAATGRGVALTLISLPERQRDLVLSDNAREAVLAAITTEPTTRAAAGAGGAAGAATTLRAVAHHTTALTERERGLLDEWLRRIAETPG